MFFGKVLAPMAGVTDRAFRMISKSLGADLVFTEMISAKGLWYKNEKTWKMIDIIEDEKPIAVQIFGHEPEVMAEAARYIESKGADIVDLNFGCPTKKIVKNGDGCVLMKNPKLAGEIMRCVVNAVSIPVTIKIRAGWDENSRNATEMARIAESAGIKAVSIHCRTASQFFKGKADWEVARVVKQNIGIPVIANGDIVDGKTALACLQYTGCDGLMVGRAALGNPWIFDIIARHLNNQEPKLISKSEMAEIMLSHIQKIVEFKGEKTGIKEARKHLIWYAKKATKQTKNQISQLNNLNEVKHFITCYISTLP